MDSGTMSAMSNVFAELLTQECIWNAGQQGEVLPSLPARPGVWLLLADDNVPILAATSQNIRASVTGRLAPPVDSQPSKKTDLSTTVTACRYVVTYGRFESDWLFGQLVHAAWPDDFWARVGFAPMWMLQACCVMTPQTQYSGGIMKVQPATRWPEEPDTIALGPLASRGDAQDLADLLTDLFDLCRYWQILAKAPQGTACAYHEMGRSKAPCSGLQPLEEYNHTVRTAMDLAGAGRTRLLQEKQAEMRATATNLQFEKAASLKSWIERTSPLAESRFQYLGDAGQFRGVVVSKFRNQVRPFFFWSGIIEAGDAVKASKLLEYLPAWLARLEAGTTQEADEATRQWQCGLLTTHLFRQHSKDLCWLPIRMDMAGWQEGAQQLAAPSAGD